MARGRRWLAWLMLLALPPASLAQQQLRTYLDRDTVFAGETVVLRIEVNDPVDDQGPDYGPLAADFEVLDTGTNARVEFVNGRRSTQVTYTATLEPRREGQLTIPSLPVAGKRSTPLTLAVMTRPDGRTAGDEDVFIEVEAEPSDPYVHAQVRLTVRLYHAPPITEGSLNPQNWPDGVVVERLGDDTTYQTVLGNQRYRVIERRYALFPERSGPLLVPEIRFRGRVADNRSGMNSLFSRGRLVTAGSRPIELKVRPQPASFSGDSWLPAASFEVTEVWPQGAPRFVVGEPLTRTLVTRAKGLLAAQLPEFNLPEIDGIKVYPDQPASQTRTDGSWALASREDKFALVPVRPGPLTLPEIRIPWWDTEADQARVVIIPARQVEIAPSTGVAPPLDLAIGGAQTQASGAAGAARPAGSSAGWRELSALLAVLWLLTLWLWLRARRRLPAARPPVEVPQNPTLRQWRGELRQACRNNDPRAAERAVLGWGSAAAGQPLTSLAVLAARIDDDALRGQLQDLERALYGPAEIPWQGAALADAAKQGLRLLSSARRAKTPPSVLPPLYPETGKTA